MKRPCAVCGEPSEQNRCEQHQVKRKRERQSTTARGYDRSWRLLSERARRLQGFCSDCGATEDLQADHTPEAWRRKEQGKTIRLRDIAVVCGPCNRKRGAARGQNPRGETPPDPRRDAPGRRKDHHSLHTVVVRR